MRQGLHPCCGPRRRPCRGPGAPWPGREIGRLQSRQREGVFGAGDHRRGAEGHRERDPRRGEGAKGGGPGRAHSGFGQGDVGPGLEAGPRGYRGDHRYSLAVAPEAV